MNLNTSNLKTANGPTLVCIPSDAVNILNFAINSPENKLPITIYGGRHTAINEQLKTMPVEAFISEMDRYYNATNGEYGIPESKSGLEEFGEKDTKMQYLYMRCNFAASNYDTASLTDFFISILNDEKIRKAYEKNMFDRITETDE